MRRRVLAAGLFTLVLSALAAAAVIARGAAPTEVPGALGGGETLLPNGWRIAPAGRHLAIGDLPLNLVLSPDGKYLIVSNNGYAKPTLRVVDLDRGEIVQILDQEDAWLGLAWSPDGTHLYSSGAASNSVVELSWKNGRLTPSARLPLGKSAEAPGPGLNRPAPTPQSFVGGVAVSPDGRRLAAVHVLGQVVSLVDLRTGLVRASADLPAEPYTALFSKDGSTLFVSLWGGAAVASFDAATLAPKGSVTVGEHPNAMVQAADGRL